MSQHLALNFLGAPQLYLDNAPIPAGRRKAVALLAYLAIERGSHRRESLSALLWPDYDQSKAFTNLRHTLWEIQQSLSQGWLITDHEKIGLNEEADIYLDVRQFESLLAQNRTQKDISLRISLLEESAKLYRNHFLTGFSLKDASDFNEWAFAKSEDLRCQLAGALIGLTEDYCTLGQAEQAIPYTRRLITLDPLNESAHRRLMKVYWQAGQQSAALKQYLACEEILRKELDLDPQPETYALYKQIRKGETKFSQVAGPAEKVSPRNNLPYQLSSFIGREKEQKEIADLIVHHRLVTLTGTGGIGKTRLSIQVAATLLNDFPDGTWLVEFAPISDPMLVSQAIVTALGLIEETGLSPLNLLTGFLHSKRALLILDNCEHLVQVCAELAETLLRACPNLRILSTSRETLNTGGEVIYLVPTLTIPNPEHVMLEILSQYEAVQLFLERARMAIPGFSMTYDNAFAIMQICHQLDGIPLALELAAACIRTLCVQQIAERLNHALRLLTKGERTAPQRHQTLRATLDWSYDLLSKKEQSLLQRLSVFAGGFALEAAEIVCADVEEDGILSNEVFDLLASLINKSLITAEREQSKETRYHMLETIRQYAREKLLAVQEGEMMRQRHLTYFVDLAERAEPNLHMSDMVMWLDRLEIEISNIRAALEWAFESDIDFQLRLASALCRFWQLRDHKSEGTEWLERALSIEMTKRGDQPLMPSLAIIRGKALYVAGYLRVIFRETDKAIALSKESLTLFRELGPAGKQGMAYALWNLAEVAEQQKDLRVSKTMMEQSLALFQEVNDKFGIAQCLPGLAYTALIVDSNYEQAGALAEEGLTLYKEMGDKNGLARILWTLGDVAWLRGDYKQVNTCYEASLGLFREVGNKYTLGVVLRYLGEVAKAQGHYEKAIMALEEALAIALDSGMKILAADAHYSLGEVAAVEGDHMQAIGHYEQGLATGQQTGNPERIADGFFGLGRVACAKGEYEQAIQKFEASLAVSREASSKFRTTRALYGLARVVQAKGDYAAARSLYLEAIIISQEISNRFFVAFDLEALATVAVAQKRFESPPLCFEGFRQAARLFGAAQAFHAGIRFELFPAERAEYDHALAVARVELGDEDFDTAFEEGKKMRLEEAVAYAIENA